MAGEDSITLDFHSHNMNFFNSELKHNSMFKLRVPTELLFSGISLVLANNFL